MSEIVFRTQRSPTMASSKSMDDVEGLIPAKLGQRPAAVRSFFSRGQPAHRQPCCSLPVVKIEHYDYGSEIKSLNIHFAPLEKMKSTLPYPHRHDFYHIVWVTRGTGCHIIDAVKYEVRPNSLFFMAPGQIHDFTLSEDAIGHTISFSPEFFAFRVHNRHSLTDIPIYSIENLNNALYLDDMQAESLRQITDAMIEEYTAEKTGHEDVIWSYLRIFLMKTSRIAVAPAIADLSSRNLLLSRRFKSALEKNFGTMNETAEYARLLKVTERALNEATRQALGSTAAQLIRERIMLEAKRLLLHSDISVTEIADRLGFEDPAYFSRCFKKHTTRSPVEFRQSLATLNL
ncbi:helix-turn-helix domain-containing protein [Bradyrhizobium sp. BWA-3-5]|uniref:helix-turn-helix domain-containing protein n=1 Tax=Bradyrhizobium sp. BWA-3-5 TaxID=3080013 RepID=UPI00293E229D|nr:helix-turn-helix domain-containing protein [Bradyrhizobium sp. BWA-3-5]WOH64032.1 helix-turn-helix domain-containing protein [Bradyrhizobium sp. BWA-3-5]